MKCSLCPAEIPDIRAAYGPLDNPQCFDCYHNPQTTTCETCSGLGKYLCDCCDGFGTHMQRGVKVPCLQCNHGKIECPDCDDGSVTRWTYRKEPVAA